MSMWMTDKEKKARRNREYVPPKKGKFSKFTHWPNPLTNMIKSIDVLACEDTWQAEVQMWGIGAAAFFWSNFIPSPVELTRKATMGGYKCGFYLPIEVKSPLDVIWKDGSASSALLEIASPITTGLFYWWAAETALDALNLFSSLMMAEELCDKDGNECLIRDGDVEIVGAAGDFEVSAALYEIVYDPGDRYGELGYQIDPWGFEAYTANAYGYIAAGPSSVSNLTCYIKCGGTLMAQKPVADIAGGNVGKFSVSFDSGGANLGLISVWFKGHKDQFSVIPVRIHVDRFTVKGHKASPPERENWNSFPFKDPFLKSCWQKYFDNEL